jgi:hypothetical protein
MKAIAASPPAECPVSATERSREVDRPPMGEFDQFIPGSGCVGTGNSGTPPMSVREKSSP